MPSALADLHTHTIASDGTLAPAELVRCAADVGLRALAVTDHDTVDGLPEAMAAGDRYGIEVIPGIELSVTVGELEVHLLGFMMDPAHAGLRAHVERFRTARADRARAMTEKLQTLGVPLAYETVQAQAGDGVVGRPHVAAALVEGGFVADQQEAFERYIGDRAPAYVGKPRFPAARALAMLHDAGGIGVLAHPGHWTSDRTVMHLVRAGLDGIEVVHPSHDDVLTTYYRRLARDFVLLETGGSDYHGSRPHDAETLGVYGVPYDRLERMRLCASRHAAARLAS